jgi:hypothetical protein
VWTTTLALLNCNHQGRKGKRGEKIKVKI